MNSMILNKPITALLDDKRDKQRRNGQQLRTITVYLGRNSKNRGRTSRHRGHNCFSFGKLKCLIMTLALMWEVPNFLADAYPAYIDNPNLVDYNRNAIDGDIVERILYNNRMPSKKHASPSIISQNNGEFIPQGVQNNNRAEPVDKSQVQVPDWARFFCGYQNEDGQLKMVDNERIARDLQEYDQNMAFMNNQTDNFKNYLVSEPQFFLCLIRC